MTSPDAPAAPSPSEASATERLLSERIAEMLFGFELSQAMYVLAKFDVATAMLSGPRPVPELAAETGTHEPALRRILRTLAGMDLVRPDGADAFALTEHGTLLADGVPGSARNLAIMLMETHYAAFGRLSETVRTGVPAATLHYGKPFLEWLVEAPERANVFSAAMANATDGIRHDALANYRLPPGELAADIGGADGSVLVRLLADEPERQGVVFDLPTVVPAARERITWHGLADRVRVEEGSFFETAPTADVYLLSMVLHDWDDDACRAILHQLGRAAEPGARLVVLEAVVPSGDEPHFSRVTDLTMLGMVEGRERTEAEFAELFGSAGFRLDRVVTTPSRYSFLEATLVP